MNSVYDYMRKYAGELGARIVETYAPLHGVKDKVAPEVATLLRTPFAAQNITIMGVAKYFTTGGKSAKIVAECGAGKTLISLAAAHVHAKAAPFSMVVMCPPHLVKKWAREAILTVPFARTFIIEDLRNGGAKTKAHGVNETRLINGEIMRRGLATTLPKLRAMGRKGWKAYCRRPAVFIMGKEMGKLSYFWKPAYATAKSGPELGGLINPDSGRPVPSKHGGNLSPFDLDDTIRFSEQLQHGCAEGQPYERSGPVEQVEHGGNSFYSPLWQADRNRIQRMAPLEYIGRYMKGWFDYAVADEVHQLANDTAQGNGLAVLARAARWLMTLTGTMMGGYADDMFRILYRVDGPKMAREGYEWGSQGQQDFQRTYGVIETVETSKESENACSRAKKRSVTILRKPGSSPLLFGKHLMESTAFVSLEDISDQLPPYEEQIIPVNMDKELAKAYGKVENDIRDAIKKYPKDKGLRSIMLNTLLAYPDHPFGWEPIKRKMLDRRTRSLTVFTVTKPANLSEDVNYEKERRLVEDIKKELREGRRCQVYATYTGKHDVTARLESVLKKAGIRCAVLRSTVPTDQREAWYDRRLKEGVEVVLCHPRLVETGLDLLAFPTLYFYETGYSLYTLRQASRRSWRIGQTLPVRVKFFAYNSTMQNTCIRLMGKKLLVALMMEGKFSGEGLQSMDADEDMMSAMARELVEKAGVGETADAIWRELDRERSKLMPPPAPAMMPDTDTGTEADPLPVETPTLPAAASVEAPLVVPSVPLGPTHALLQLAVPKPRKRHAPAPDPGQLSLFAA
jgi:hypothetical protein